MAPAAPGGGWDTTARAFQAASRDAKLDDGIEVFNVEGAGGTLGLSQLVSKDSGDPYQLMMTGLVMLGAIETNGSDVALDAHDADRDDDHRDRGDRRPGEVEVPVAQGPGRRLQARPGLDPLGGRLGGRHRPAAGRRARARARRRPGEDQVRRALRRRRGERGDPLRLGRRRRVRAVASSSTRSRRGKMRLLAVSSPVDIEIDGRKPPTIKDEGIDLELTNWRALAAPPGISDAERERITGWVEKVAGDAGVDRRTSSATTGRRS